MELLSGRRRCRGARLLYIIPHLEDVFMKKFAVFVLAAALCAVGLCAPVAVGAATYAPSFEVTAPAVFMLNLDSEMLIYDKNADTRLQPGPLAQLMTVVLAMEKVADPENEIVTLKSYIEDEIYTYNRSLGGVRLAGLYRNEQISVKNLLYAVMLRDANEAAAMLGDYVGDGSVPYFVQMMNERAAELGMQNTHFTSPHGLPDENAYTTARDMAILAQHAVQLPGFEEIAATINYDGGPTNINDSLQWNTTNRMIVSTSPYYNRSAIGVKGGYVRTLGSYAITMAKRDGYTYLLVVMASNGLDANGKADPVYSAFTESSALMSWAFSTFRVKNLLEKGRGFGEVPLRLSWGKDFLRVMSADNFTALIPDAIEASSVKFILELPEYVEAPIEKGTLIGQVRLELAQEELGVVGLIAAESAEASRSLILLETLIGITRTFWFKFCVVFLLGLIVAYIVLMVVRNRNRRRYQNRVR